MGRTRWWTVAGLASVGLWLAACGGPGMQIRADRNPSADFGRYASYAWASAPAQGAQWPARDDRTAFDWQVRKLVDQQLAARGYGRAAAGSADFLVDYRVSQQEKVMNDSFGEYARYRSEGGREGLGETWVGGYQEGTLLIEATDARSRGLVWYGSATAVVNPKLRQERLPVAVGKIFESFPARR